MTPRVHQYASEIATKHGVSAEALLAPRKWSGAIPHARRELYRRLRADGFTSSQIGMWTGRDPSTVRAALTRGW